MEEIWRDIPGREGRYQVSNLGNARRLRHVTEKGTHLQAMNCKAYIDTVGYYHFNMNGSVYVHRVVAIAFLPNLEGKREVNHKDGDKSNNCLDNLEWMTKFENAQHAKANGLNYDGRNSSSGSSYKGWETRRRNKALNNK